MIPRVLAPYFLPKLSWRFSVVGICLLGAGLLMSSETASGSQENVEVGSHPCPIKAELWVLAGQSNMQAWGRLKEPLKLDPRRIMNFRMNNQWDEPFEPIHWNAEAADSVHKALLFKLGLSPEQYAKERASRPIVAGGVDVGVAFARHIVENTDVNVSLIPCAMGGIAIEEWDPARKREGPASLYGSMYDRIQMVGGRIAGILWYQGESDAYPNAAPYYEKRFLDLIDAIRRNTNEPDLPFIYVQIGRYFYPDRANGKWWEAIRETQRRVAGERRNVYMVSAVDAELGDGIHLSAQGQEQVGRRLAEVALTEVYHKPGHGTPIALKSIEVIGGETPTPEIHVKFSGVTGRLKAEGRPADFELRSDDPPKRSPVIYRTDLDPDDPAGLIPRVNGAITGPTKLLYGSGMTPYMNLVDEANMALPAFGPLDLSKRK
jgi:sialate O-acetylesterase